MHSISKIEENLLNESKERETLLDYLKEDVHLSNKILSFIDISTFSYVPALVSTHEQSCPPIVHSDIQEKE